MEAGRLRQLTLHGAANLLGMVLPILVGLVTIPMLVRLTGVERFACISLVWLIIGYASLLDFGFGQALTKTLSENQVRGVEPEVSSALNWSIQSLLAIIGVIAGLILWPVVAGPGPRLLQFKGVVAAELARGSMWIALSLALVVSTSGLRGALIAYHKFVQINIARSVSGTLQFIVPLVVATNGGGVSEICIGICGVRVLTWGYHAWILQLVLPCVRCPSLLHRSELGEPFAMAGWLTLSNLANVALVSMDRIMIGVLIGARAIAWYSAPSDVLSKLWLVPNAITAVLFPTFVKDGIVEPAALARTHAIGQGLLLAVIFPACLVLASYSESLICLWLGTEFSRQAWAVSSLLTVGYFLNIGAHIPFTTVQALGYSRRAALFQAGQVPLFLVLLFVGARWNGLTGIAFAFVIRMAGDSSYFMRFGDRLAGLEASVSWKFHIFYVGGAGAMLALAFAAPGSWKLACIPAVLIVFYALLWFGLMNRLIGGGLAWRILK